MEFPHLMKLRPIIVDENFIALGGNMRDRAIFQIAKMGKPAVVDYLNSVSKPKNIKFLDPLFKGYFPEGWILEVDQLG